MMNFKKRIIDKKVKKELSLKDGIIVIDKSSCDGCGNCIDICPKSAINIITLSDEQIKRMSFKGKLKVKIKGRKRANINSDLCISCSLCMKQCHEFAIHKTQKQELIPNNH